MSKPDPTELHAAIMNLPCKVRHGLYRATGQEAAYLEGHRDARHAAAELVSTAVPALVQPEPSIPQGHKAMPIKALRKLGALIESPWTDEAAPEVLVRMRRVWDEMHSTHLAASPSASQPEPSDAQAMAFHRALTDGDISSDELEDIKRGLRAAFAASASLTPPAPEATNACPPGWVTEAFEAIWTARPGTKITDDMKRAAAIALRLARGERWDDSKQDWAAAPVPSPEPTSDALAAHAIEELHQLGYTVRDGDLIPPDNLHDLARVAGFTIGTAVPSPEPREPITVAMLAKAAGCKALPIIRALNVLGAGVTLNQPLDLGLIGAALSHAGCSLAAPPSLPETVTDAQWMAEAERLADVYARRHSSATQLAMAQPSRMNDDSLTQDARAARDAARAALLAHIGKRPAMSEALIYVASRASVPARPAMWKRLRGAGWPINSSWIDEAGPGETADMGELWARIEREIRSSRGVVLYANESDFPLKGAYVEVGMALGMGKRVAVVTDVAFENRQFRPFGSWMNHPLVCRCFSLESAKKWVLSTAPAQPTGKTTDADGVQEDRHQGISGQTPMPTGDKP